MSYHIGKTKQDQNIKVALSPGDNQYNVIKEGLILETYDSRQAAIEEGQRQLLGSYISNSQEVDEILNSQLEINYNYFKEE